MDEITLEKAKKLHEKLVYLKGVNNRCLESGIELSIYIRGNINISKNEHFNGEGINETVEILIKAEVVKQLARVQKEFDQLMPENENAKT